MAIARCFVCPLSSFLRNALWLGIEVYQKGYARQKILYDECFKLRLR